MEDLGHVADESTVALKMVAPCAPLEGRADAFEAARPLDWRHCAKVPIEHEARSNVQLRSAHSTFDEVCHPDVALVTRLVPEVRGRGGDLLAAGKQNHIIRKAGAPEGAPIAVAMAHPALLQQVANVTGQQWQEFGEDRIHLGRPGGHVLEADVGADVGDRRPAHISDELNPLARVFRTRTCAAQNGCDWVFSRTKV